MLFVMTARWGRIGLASYGISKTGFSVQKDSFLPLIVMAFVFFCDTSLITGVLSRLRSSLGLVSSGREVLFRRNVLSDARYERHWCLLRVNWTLLMIQAKVLYVPTSMAPVTSVYHAFHPSPSNKLCEYVENEVT